MKSLAQVLSQSTKIIVHSTILDKYGMEAHPDRITGLMLNCAGYGASVLHFLYSMNAQSREHYVEICHGIHAAIYELGDQWDSMVEVRPVINSDPWSQFVESVVSEHSLDDWRESQRDTSTTLLSIPGVINIRPGDRGRYVDEFYREINETIQNLMRISGDASRDMREAMRAADKMLLSRIYTRSGRLGLDESPDIFLPVMSVFSSWLSE